MCQCLGPRRLSDQARLDRGPLRRSRRKCGKGEESDYANRDRTAINLRIRCACLPIEVGASNLYMLQSRESGVTGPALLLLILGLVVVVLISSRAKASRLQSG